MSRTNGYTQQPRNVSEASQPFIAASNTASMNRAQRFEDEKRRIIESCFSKTDEQGQLAESYITHLRIIEDAAHPSNPPPPDSPPENKKPRVIVVAVRSTGRVRMHKARENNNGSFSIGKTWNLEDLSAIESFAHPGEQDDLRAKQYAAWAGSVGFVVTIIKPYYWAAGTPKERDFFIASLVKIFKKYTKGRNPDLRGFEPNETDALFGPLMGQQPAPRNETPPQPPFAAQPRPSSSLDSRGSRPRMLSDDQGRPSQPAPSSSPQAPFAARQRIEPPARQGTPSSQARRDQPGPPDDPPRRLRQQASRENLQRTSREQPRAEPALAGAARGPPLHAPAQFSRSEPRSESPDIPSISTTNRPPGTVPFLSPKKQRAQQGPQLTVDAAEDPSALFTSTRDRWKPQNAQQNGQPDQSPVDQRMPPPKRADTSDMRDLAAVGEISRSYQPEGIPAAQALPERRRPPMSSRQNTEDLRPPPLSTRNISGGSRPRSPAIEQLPGAFYESPDASHISLPTSAVEQQERQFSFTKSPQTEQGPIPGSAPASAAFTASPVASPVQTPEIEMPEEDAHRPGLGPMIKKRNKGDVANQFRKAATAYNAFKPRAGGAGERLARSASTDDADGINGVVPAPLRTTSDVKSMTSTPEPSTANVLPPPQEPEALPKVTLETASAVGEAEVTQLVDGPAAMPPSEPKDLQPASTPIAEARIPKRRSPLQEKNLASLGIEARLLDGRGLEFESILSDFGWANNMLKGSALDDLEHDIRREIGRVEAGSWLGHLEQKDERAEMVDKMLDRAIAECDELDGLLTLYSVELGTLNDDIVFIEAQSQGLQVQTANQKILHAELHNLVDTISITPEQLQPLLYGNFDDLEEMEAALLLLYKAMLTIDPTIRSANSISGPAIRPIDTRERSELSNMHALQEKRELYLSESERFCQRLVNRLASSYDPTLKQALPTLTRSSTGVSASAYKLNIPSYNAARASLWQFGPLLLYTKEVNLPAWRHLLSLYNEAARPLYNDVFRDSVSLYKRAVRKPAGDEADLLFTSVKEETSEGLTSTARKLTVKRSQTLAKSFRTASGEKSSPHDSHQPGRLMPCEVFAGVVDEWAPVLSMEQNFVVDLFHANSLENLDFADALAMFPPEARRGTDVTRLKIMEPDRAVAGYVTKAMEREFDFWPAELRILVEWAVAGDPLQGVGILTTLALHSAPLHETSQEYLLRTLTETSYRLQNLYQKFVDDQIRAIEDTKVKIKKRKGVIAFMRVFPPFSTTVENIFSSVAGVADSTPAVKEVRALVDDSYERINKAMWDSLTQIAKSSPTSNTGPGQGADAEDKQILNYHILLIENMNHYIEEVDEGGKEGSVLVRWKSRALMDRAEHMEEYVKRVVRRPLGKIVDFLDSAGSHRPDATLAARPSHSRSAAKKLLAAHDAREIRRGIDTLRRRIEKHFGEADDEALAQKLVALVCAECEREYDRVRVRLQDFCRDVYRDEEKGALEVEWGRDDVAADFRR